MKLLKFNMEIKGPLSDLNLEVNSFIQWSQKKSGLSQQKSELPNKNLDFFISKFFYLKFRKKKIKCFNILCFFRSIADNF